MTPVDRAAFVSIGRANSFVLLGIACIAFGLMYQPPLAAFVCGVLCLSQAVILLGFARWSRNRPYHHTETWLIMSKDDRPPGGFAQQVVSVALHTACMWFARRIVWYGGILLAMSIALSSLGVTYLEMDQRHLLYSDHEPPFLLSPTNPAAHDPAGTP